MEKGYIFREKLMKKNVLITNLNSYIGLSLCNQMSNRSNNLFGFYNEGDAPEKYADLKDKICLIPLTISNILSLKKHLLLNSYDTVIHIPDFHNNPNRSRKKLRRANVFATQQIIEFCLNAKAKLIYCSSVAVYGNSPIELPSHDRTEKIVFGYRAKIILEIESLIEQNRLKGLKAVILRPAVMYGKGYSGFINILKKLIKYKLLPKVNERIYIHLCSIKLFIDILEQAITNEEAIGKNYNVADYEPIILTELTNYISNKMRKRDYKTIFLLNLYVGRNIANLLYKLNYVFGGNFMERLTHNWFYDIEDLIKDFSVQKVNTFMEISEILD